MNIKSIIENGENRFVEFKSDYSKTLLKTVSAYANYNTGRILVGVGDDGSIIGLTDPDQVCLSIENAIKDGIEQRPYYELIKRDVGVSSVVELVVYCGENTPYMIRFQGNSMNRFDSRRFEKESVLHRFYELMNIFKYYYPVSNVIESDRRQEAGSGKDIDAWEDTDLYSPQEDVRQ